MSVFPKKYAKIILFLVSVIALATFASTRVHATHMKSKGYADNTDNPDWNITNLTKQVQQQASLPQPPEQDQCLHCHIAGSNENLWTPLARWAVFGVTGLIVSFGITRSAWVWRNKKPWVPLTTRAGNWIDERYKIKDLLEKILSKPVPYWATKWWYCLGGMTAFLFVIQAITGIMLAFYYQPTPENAYASIQYIENEVFFGASIRAVHHWAANGMVIMCIAHMLRVFIMGAFKPPRELNWSSGVILFIVTMGFGFTGYLLPWDQRAYWATTVGTEIAGGVPDIGELILVFLRVGWGISAATLSRFYALHILVLPILVILTMGMHFMMVRRQGLKEPL